MMNRVNPSSTGTSTRSLKGESSVRGRGLDMSCFSRASPLVAMRPLVAHISSEAIDMKMAAPPSSAKTMSPLLHVQR